MSSFVTQILIPVGSTAGETLEFATKDGKRYQYTIPHGSTPGDLLNVIVAPAASGGSSRSTGATSLNSSTTQATSLNSSTTQASSMSSTLTTQIPTLPSAPPFKSYSDADEIAIRELLVQRCLEIFRMQGKNVNYESVSKIVAKEFGHERFHRYKSLVEYHVKRHALQQHQEEFLHQQHRHDSGEALQNSIANQTESGAKIELPRLVACLGGCGFWGNPDKKNLCNRCFSNLVQNDLTQVTKAEAIQDMLLKLGFCSIDDYMLDLAFTRRFPTEVYDVAARHRLPGVHKWYNSARPITQFDKAPEKGTTACTYISGVTALRALFRNEFAKTPSEWADCILRGVIAFHSAARCDPRLKGHSHISEAMPYALEVLGCTPSDAQRYKVHEQIVLLYLDPIFEGSQPSEILGPAYADSVGKEGLVLTLRKAFQECQALVITRPPETWAVTLEIEKLPTEQAQADCSGAPTGIVRLRDSHRRAQLDFESLGAFLSWVTADRAFFAAVPSTGIDMNSVSISWFVSKSNSSTVSCDNQAQTPLNLHVAAPFTSPRHALVKGAENVIRIIDRLFISDYDQARSMEILRHYSISHILNTSPLGSDGSPTCPNANGERLTYYNFPLDDRFIAGLSNATINTDLVALFRNVAATIQSVLSSSSSSNLLIHAGNCDTSVAPACALAFLLIHQHCTLLDAYTMIEQKKPNMSVGYTAFKALVQLEKSIQGASTMSLDDRGADMIIKEIESMGFKDIDRGRIVELVKNHGLQEAQSRALDECLN